MQSAYLGDGGILNDHGHTVHAKIDQDGGFGRNAVDEADEQRAKQLASQIDASHLRVHG